MSKFSISSHSPLLTQDVKILTSKPACFRASMHCPVNLMSGRPSPISISACNSLIRSHLQHKWTHWIINTQKKWRKSRSHQPLSFGAFHCWDQRNQSYTTHMQQNTDQALTLGKSLCNTHTVASREREKIKTNTLITCNSSAWKAQEHNQGWS